MYFAAPMILLYLGSIYDVHYLIAKQKQKKLESKSPIPNAEALNELKRRGKRIHVPLLFC